MPVSYDQQRKQYIARITHEGKRYYIGRYDTKKLAEVAVDVRAKMLKKLSETNIDTYELEYEKINKGFVNRLVARYRKRKAEKNNAIKVDAVQGVRE